MVSRLTVLVLQQRPGIPQARPVGERWLRYRLSQYPDIPPLFCLASPKLAFSDPKFSGGWSTDQWRDSNRLVGQQQYPS